MTGAFNKAISLESHAILASRIRAALSDVLSDYWAAFNAPQQFNEAAIQAMLKAELQVSYCLKTLDELASK